MKILNYALTGLTALGVAVFAAYFGLEHGVGLLTTLPDSITQIFTRNEGLQFVALGLVVVALLAKVFVVRALKRQEAESRI